MWSDEVTVAMSSHMMEICRKKLIAETADHTCELIVCYVRTYSTQVSQSPILLINSFSKKAKNHIKRALKLFCEIEDVFSNFAVSINLQMLYFKLCIKICGRKHGS